MDTAPTSVRGRSRRQHPRITIDGIFVAQDLTLGQLVRLRDISLGGFRTEAACPVAPGSLHTFRAVLPNGEDRIMCATAMHCHPVVGPRSVCIVGWQAAGDQTTAESLGRLVDVFSGRSHQPAAAGTPVLAGAAAGG